MATTPRDQLRQLVRQGFYANNVHHIISIAEQLFYDRPTPYGSVVLICRLLLNEQDSEQGTTTQRLLDINQALQQPMLNAIDAEFDPPARLIDALHELHRGFFSLS